MKILGPFDLLSCDKCNIKMILCEWLISTRKSRAEGCSDLGHELPNNLIRVDLKRFVYKMEKHLTFVQMFYQIILIIYSTVSGTSPVASSWKRRAACGALAAAAVSRFAHCRVHAHEAEER